MKPARFLSASLPTLLLTFALAPVFQASAASYASGISITGTTVNFTLNETADLVTYSINGGAPQTLADASKGQKSFSLGSATDTFSITAVKNSATGYTIPTGATVANAAGGLGLTSNEAGYDLIGTTAINSPRGVAIANNPNNPNFGTTYLSNSAAGTLGDGLYALKADQSDAFGYGAVAQTGGINFGTSASSPFRVSVGEDNNVYIADFSDTAGTVYSMSPNLATGAVVLAGIGGPTALPSGQNHGSTTAVYVTGSSAAGNLTLYTVDEDLTSGHVAGGAATTDRNSLWKYTIGSGTSNFAGMPAKVNNAAVLLPAATSDMDRGSNGLWYLAQNRAAGGENGLAVLSAEGATLFESRAASLAAGQTQDIFRNIQGMAVSPDNKYIAVVLNNSDIAVIPLDENGIPNIDGRVVVNTGADINSGRDIAFDAAGNIHYVSSGQAAYRVIAPGGYTSTTLSYNGTSYSFVAVPEPTGSALVLGGLLAAAGRRRRCTA